MTVSLAHQGRWVSAVTAARILGCSSNRVRKLGQGAFITVRQLPGADPRYRLDDVERLAPESTTAATADRLSAQPG